MSNISIDDVKKLARLSSLEINDTEAEILRGNLESIIGFFDALNEVDTSDLEPTAQVTGLTNVVRPDEIKEYDVDRDALLKNVPHTQDGYIKVKRVLSE